MTKAEQDFIDALNALASEQHISFKMPDGLVRLDCIQFDSGPVGGAHFSLTLRWWEPLPGDRYADYESTAADMPHETLTHRPALIEAAK